MGGAFDYYKDELDEASPFGYYAGRPKEDRFNAKGQKIVFNEVHGEFGLELGLRFGMSEEEFREIEAGHFNLQSIDSQGNPIYEYQTGSGRKTAWIDVTYAVPKSISELFARAASNEEARAIALAVKEAALESHKECVEDSAKVARINTGKVEGLPPGTNKAKLYGQTHVTAKLIYIPVMGFTNRDGQPHLHIHMPTATMCKVGDKVLTADEWAIKATAGYRMDVFSGKVAAKVRALGYDMDFTDLETARNGRMKYEAADSSKSLRRHWSTDRDDVARKEYFAKFGHEPNAVQLEKWMRASRPKKTDKEQDQNPDRSRWIAEAEVARAEALSKIKTPAARTKAEKAWDLSPVKPGRSYEYEPLDKRLELLKARLYGPEGLCIRNSRFTGSEIRPAIARLSTDLGLTKEQRFEFEKALRQELVVDRESNDDRFAYFTTERILDAEQTIANELYARRSGYKEVAEHFIQIALKSNSAKPLDASQQKVLRAACSAAGIVLVEAPAGSGKTTTAQSIISALSISGAANQFFYASRGAKLAEDVGPELRGITGWGSIKSLCDQITSGVFSPDKNTVILLDEVAVVDTFPMERLLELSNGAKIVAMGDPEQLNSIGASGWYADAKEVHEVHELEKVWRHTDEIDPVSGLSYMTRDFGLIRQGKGVEAAANMADQNRIHVAEDHEAKVELAVEHLRFHLVAGKKVEDVRIVVDTSNQDVDYANRLVQDALHVSGEIQGEGFRVHEPEQARDWSIHQGDQILFLKPYSEKAESRMPGRSKYVTIRNGTQANVLKIDHATGTAKVLLHNGRLETVHLDERIGLAYAQHTAKFQGSQVKIVLGLPGKGSTSNSIYSMLTRAIEAAHVFLDFETHTSEPAVRFGEQASEKVAKHSAHYYLAHKTAMASEKLQARAEDLTTFIDQNYDYSVAESIISSEAFEALVVRADRLNAQGLNANEVIARVIAERELSTAEDTAKVILWRLDQHSEFTQERADYDEFDWELIDPELKTEMEARDRLSEFNRNWQSKERREQDQGMGRSL